MALGAVAEATYKACLNIAEACNDIAYGAQGWIQNSHITWITTAMAYYSVKLASGNSVEILGNDAKKTAKYAALLCSIYGFAQGVFARGKRDGKDVSITDLPPKRAQLIMITNTVALALYLEPSLTKQAIVPIALAYTAARAIDYFVPKS